MKKIIAMIILGMLFINSHPVQAEESETESGGLLSKTSNHLLGTTDKLVKTVHTTVNEVEKTIPVLNPVTDVVSEVGKSTLPAVEGVVTSIIDTTETVLSEVGEGVDQTVKTLPTIPIVTPILTTTTQTVDEVVSEVQTVVSSSEKAVKNIVNVVVEEKDRNPIVETPKDQITVDTSNEQITEHTPSKTTKERIPHNQSIEPLNQDITNLPVEKENVKPIIETTVPINNNVAIEPVRDENPLTKVVVEEGLRVPNKDLGIYSNNMEVAESKIVQDNRITVKVEAIQSQDGRVPVNPFNPVIPVVPDPQMTVTSGITWNGPGNTFSSSGSFLSVGYDVLLGFLPSEEMLKELTKKKWYHKNSYAIIQWIHTPLRKPPELTPFLYVI